MLPKTGRTFLGRKGERDGGQSYTAAIRTALREELGESHRSIKTVMRWTGASERTVKNWFAGASGPSGEHLVAIVRHSDAAFTAVMLLADRNHAVAAKKLVEARDTLAAMLEIIVDLTA